MNTKKEYMFNSEKQLKSFVEANASELFGEDIIWIDPNLDAEFVRPIRPDFLGKYEDGQFAIIELKMVSKFMEKGNANSYHPMRIVVGQCLHYFHALAESVEGSTDLPEEHLKVLSQIFRIFIVTDVYAEPVENMCRVLRAHGIQIKCIDASSCLDD